MEGPVHIPGGKGQRAPVDLLVEETARVGPGNPGIIRFRPMNEYDDKDMVAATRPDVQAAEARLEREACIKKADSQCRKGARFENAPCEM